MIFAVGRDLQAGTFLQRNGLADMRTFNIPERFAGKLAGAMLGACIEDRLRTQ